MRVISLTIFLATPLSNSVVINLSNDLTPPLGLISSQNIASFNLNISVLEKSWEGRLS